MDVLLESPPPPPPLETSRTFFDIYLAGFKIECRVKSIKVLYLLSFVETPRKFIVAIINLRGVFTKLNKYIVFTMQTYKKLIIKVLLGQSQELIMSIHINLRCKYTYENAGFCILCIDGFKILKLLSNYRNFPRFFPEKRHRRQPPPSTPTSVWRFSWTKSICDASLTYNCPKRNTYSQRCMCFVLQII